MKTRAAPLFATLLAVAGCSSSAGPPVMVHPTTAPAAAIAHVVIVLQENRSFNNIFAGFPGADTSMEGRCKPEGAAAKWCTGNHIVKLQSVPLKSGPPNLGDDIGHSHKMFKIECDPDASGVCRMDGFDLNIFGQGNSGQAAKLYPYSYVDRKATAPYWKLAQQYTLADKMFLNDSASSFIAHQLILSGSVRLNGYQSVTDQPLFPPWGCDAPKGDNAPILFKSGYEQIAPGVFPCFTWSTIADLLDAAKVSYNYYVDQTPNPVGDFSGGVWNGFDSIKKFRFGPDWHRHISSPNTSIFSDLRDAKLGAVSWVIPSLYDSDHPASGCNGGPLWVTKVVNAIGASPYWENTAIVLLWDDWGGWYDPVPPPQVNYTSLGFRIPMIIISPYARPHHVSHTQYDYGSILRFIEQSFGLGTLGTSDASANSIEDAFDFHQKPIAFRRAALPHAFPCASRLTNPGSMKEIIDHDDGVPE